MTSTTGHNLYLDDDDGVFTNNMCLFQKYDGSFSSSVSSYSRSSRSSVSTDTGYGKSGGRHTSRQMSSDFEQEEGNTSETRDNSNGNTDRERPCPRRFIQGSHNVSSDGDSKENTDVIPCELCSNTTHERHMLRSRFTKSSFCSRCSKDKKGHISYCESPSYERGSWRRRFKAERSIDIDLTPLLDVLERIGRIDTSMGIPMHAYTKNLPQHGNERDTLDNVVNNNTDHVFSKESNTALLDNDSEKVISKHSLHDNTRSDPILFAMDSTVININKTTSETDNNLTKPNLINTTSADVQLSRCEADTNANILTDSDAEFEQIFTDAVHFNKQSVGLLHNLNNDSKQSNDTFKQDALDRRYTTHAVDQHITDTDQSLNTCSIKSRRNCLKQKSIRRTHRILLPVPSYLLNESDSDRKNHAVEIGPVNKYISSSRESKSSVTNNSDTEDGHDMQPCRNRTSIGLPKMETFKNRKRHTDRRRSLSNKPLEMNTGSDSKVTHDKEKKIGIHVDVNDTSSNSHHNIDNIPCTYEEFNSSLERETKTFDKKRSSIKKENIDTTIKADTVESTIRRNSVSKITSFWENRVTAGPNPTLESSDSEAEHISKIENENDSDNVPAFPSRISKTVQYNVKRQDNAISTETGVDEDETFRRIQNKLIIRQNSRSSIRRKSIQKNKNLTSSFLNEFLTVPGARTRNSDSESGCNTSSASIKPELTKRRVSLNSSVIHPALSTFTYTDISSSDSGHDEDQANICNNSDCFIAKMHTSHCAEHGERILPAITLTKRIQCGNESQYLNDNVYTDQKITSREENSENEHILWRRGNPGHDNSRRSTSDVSRFCAKLAGENTSTLKEIDVIKAVCKQERPSFSGNANEINKQIVNPETQYPNEKLHTDINRQHKTSSRENIKRGNLENALDNSIIYNTETNATVRSHSDDNYDAKSQPNLQDKTENIKNKDIPNHATVGKAPTVNERNDHMSVTEYLDDVFENTTKVPELKRRPRAKLFSIADEDDLDESSQLLDVPVDLDSNESSDVELSWRTRGYNADFYMSRKSTTGSEIINKFRQIVRNRSRQINRRMSSKKGSALLTQFDDY